MHFASTCDPSFLAVHELLGCGNVDGPMDETVDTTGGLARRSAWACVTRAVLVFCAVVGTTACPGPPGPDAGDDVDAGSARVRVEEPLAFDPDDVPPSALLDAESMPPGLALVDLGALGTGPDGKTSSIAVDVHTGTRSIGFLAFGDADVVLIATEVRAPDGRVVLTDTAPADVTDVERTAARGFPGQLFSVVRALPSLESTALVLPSATAVPLEPGTWRVQFGAFSVQEGGALPVVTPALRPVVVGVLLDDTPPASAAPSLSIVLHVGVEGIAAETALDDPAVAAGIAGLVDTFASVGIVVEVERTLALVDPSLRTVLLDDDTCTGGDLDTLFREADGSEGQALHLFIIERFSCEVAGGIPVGQGIAGIAGAIPGVAPARTSSHAGVAVAHAFFADHTTTFPTVVAHEVAHFLGLFHTRETTRTGVRPIADLVDDTPDTFPEARDNLMSPLAGTDRTITDGQSDVLVRHPLVRP
jgi:hypothetical protein